jgi:hypothetical protein
MGFVTAADRPFSHFSSAEAVTCRVAGLRGAIDGAPAASGTSTDIAVGLKWCATFEGKFSSVTTSYAGKRVVRYCGPYGPENLCWWCWSMQKDFCSRIGAFRTWRDARLEAAIRFKADIGPTNLNLWVHALVEPGHDLLLPD